MKTQFVVICILISLSSASFLRAASARQATEHAARTVKEEFKALRQVEAPTVTIVEETCEEKHCGHETGFGYTRCVMQNCY